MTAYPNIRQYHVPCIELGKTKVVIKPGNADQVMTGTITSDTCNWTTPYSEGSTVIHAIFEEPSGEPRHITLKLEGGQVKSHS